MRVFFAAALALAWSACGNGSEPARHAPDEADAAVAESPTNEGERTERTILFLGNSLAAGSGVAEEEAFPALIAGRIDSLGWPFHVVNAGLSGETSAGGLRRVDWLLRQEVDVLVLELGGNDGLRGTLPDATKENLQGIIDAVRTRYPDVEIVIAGMQIPPNLGPQYTESFRAIFPELAEENDATLIPFLLEGVGGVPELNQSDQIHPTAEGHKIIAETVWTHLEPVLENMMDEQRVTSAE